MDTDSKPLILSVPAGAGFYLGIAETADSPLMCAFCVREKRRYLEDIPRSPLLAVKAGYYQGKQANIIYVLWKFSGNNKTIYETYFNIAGGNACSEKCFGLLTTQARLCFVVFDTAANPARKILTPGNHLADFCRVAIEKNAGRSWLSRNFDQEKAKFQATFDGHALWDKSDFQFNTN